jgi:hypothetical protein
LRRYDKARLFALMTGEPPNPLPPPGMAAGDLHGGAGAGDAGDARAAGAAGAAGAAEAAGNAGDAGGGDRGGGR